ncbi:hypothetical protein PYCC9005_005208 [Savitreella phatthalungensis]
MSKVPKVRLRDGRFMPQLGLGVYECSDSACERSVRAALEAGYRLIDSAEWYGNEGACGKGVRGSGVPREDVFYTSKLMSLRGYDATFKALQKSLTAFGTDYLDLYLLHSPYPDARARAECWRALVDAQAKGLVRSIGVSNWGRRHLEELSLTSEVVPAVNQIDLHPWMTREDEVKYNRENGIVLEAWGPLARGERMDDPVLGQIALAHNKTPAQVLIRWSLQHGYVCIPKSVKPARIMENIAVFDFTLSDEEMTRLDGLDEYLVTDWDPIGDSRV